MYLGSCGNIFDPITGMCDIGIFTDVSDFAYKDENAIKITKSDFLVYVRHIPLNIKRALKKHKLEYLFYNNNIFVIYDTKDNMHYFFSSDI